MAHAADGLAAAPLLPRPARVRRVVRELADTVSLELEVADGAVPFQPGQFNMLYAFGAGESAISISGDPRRADRLAHTIRAVGPVTHALAGLRAGGVVGVRGPFGRGWPLAEARGRDVVVVAGGIGLAPLRPVLYEITARPGDFGRVVLLYGTRTPDLVLFRRDLERWAAAAGVTVSITVDHAGPDWRGKVGVVTELIARAAFDDAVAFVCGPELMMRFAADALRRRGIPDARIFVSMERNMKCAVGFCGHCQLGPSFVCKDGPVFPYDRLRGLLTMREV